MNLTELTVVTIVTVITVVSVVTVVTVITVVCSYSSRRGGTIVDEPSFGTKVPTFGKSL